MEKNAIFILLITIGGSMGFGLFHQCKITKCNKLITPEDLQSITRVPENEEVLNRVCPPVLDTMKCASDLVKECTGQSMEELAASENETVALFTDLVSSIKDFATNICDQNSQLHKNYVSSISCVRPLLYEVGTKCVEEAHKLYDAYKDSVAEIIDDNEGECMIIGYGIACASIQLRDRCSETASQTFLEILKSTKFVRLSYCTPKDVVTLKTRFLDYLEEQGQSRDIFANAFDFRRK